MTVVAGIGAITALALASMLVGVSDAGVSAFLPGADETARMVLWESRVPRTLALVLAGAALGVCGLLMQLLVRNRFVEPSTVGTTEAAGLGLLTVTVVAPGTSIMTKMLVATAFALVGTFMFLRIVRLLPVHSTALVPIIGMMLGGVVGAISTALAFRYDLLQTLNSWMLGDFSGVLRGRYELLWVVGVLTVIAYIAADRFTMAGLGESFAINAGLDHRRVVAVGFTIVALVSAAVVVTVGAIPFLGLVAPNLVALIVGDNARRSIPWVALIGVALVLVCDIAGRLISYPYEVPIGMIMAVLGSVMFLYLLLRRPARVRT